MGAQGRQKAGQSVAVVEPVQQGDLAVSERDMSPLLVLDAGEFLARCRSCGWRSPRESTPGEALAVFVAHECEEQPA
jgi:hypothetical protein